MPQVFILQEICKRPLWDPPFERDTVDVNALAARAPSSHFDGNMQSKITKFGEGKILIFGMLPLHLSCDH